MPDQREVRCKSVATAITVKVGTLTVKQGQETFLGKEECSRFTLQDNYTLFYNCPKSETVALFFVQTEKALFYLGKNMNKEDCITILCEKKKELEKNGVSRFPARSDFTNEEIVAIKAFLGPWPRALEAAGIKDADPTREEEKKQKRIELKRKKTELKKTIK